MNDNIRERLNDLPEFLSNHLMITVIALVAGVLITVPLAIALVRRPNVRYPVLTAAGVIQTAPALALLALMVPLIDKTNGFGLGLPAFGVYPAVIALTLYSVLPILRNTVTGILGVDPAMTEAARGVGMTERQVMWKVQLPLAAPVIIAGIRTATVWTVGIATLATPVGQVCLGNYIFTGLQTRNWTMVMFGVVAAAALAILLDLLIGGMQRAAELRRRSLGTVCASLLLLVIVGGLASPPIVQALRIGAQPVGEKPAVADVDDRDTLDRPVRIGAKTFTEQYILSALIDRQLAANGFQTKRIESLGSIIVFEALRNGNIDVYVDYSGTIWVNAMSRPKPAPRWSVLAQMTGWLAGEHGVRCLGSLGFENAYALAMRRSQAEQLRIRTIDDLAGRAAQLTIGGDYEFFGRPEWQQIRDAYGLEFKQRTSYDSSIMYSAVATGQVDVISAFSSDGRIAAFDLIVLEDTRDVIAPYDAVLLLGPTVAGNERLVKALRPLVNSINVDLMRQANHLVDRDENATTISQAVQWLHEQIFDAHQTADSPADVADE